MLSIRTILHIFKTFSNPIQVLLFMGRGIPKGECIQIKTRSGDNYIVSRNTDRWLIERSLTGLVTETRSSDTHGECIVMDGIMLRQGTADTFIYKELFIDAAYKESLARLSTDDTVIDIGAHIGLFTILAAQKGCQVYAYEAQPNNYALAKDNIASIKQSKIQLAHLALWSKSGDSIAIVEPGQGRTAEYSVKDTPTTGPTTKVKTISLEDAFSATDEKNISLLKMDIEGAEYEVLFNAPESLFNKVQSICIEYHQDPSGKYGPTDLENLFHKVGIKTRRTVINASCGLINGVR